MSDSGSPSVADAATVTGARRRSPGVPSSPTVGATVGRYVVLGPLGTGAMGIVLRAYDPRLEREVALKILRPDALSTRARARLLREARAMARLNHPNVVGLFDAETDEVHGVILTMELVDGGNLRQWLEEQREWSEVLERFVAAGRGLAAAHDAGLLHRDFKPANVLLGRDGRVRVTDFGLALATSSSDEADGGSQSEHASGSGSSASRSGAAARVTEHGLVVGTLAYMAPEQHETVELSAATDQFAYCASVWHALAGALPFDGRTAAELLVHKASGTLEWPSPSPVPSRVVTALRRGLSARPQERWPSMTALLEELDAVRTRRRRLSSVLVGGALLGATAWTAASAAQSEPEPCQQGPDQLESIWSPSIEEGLRDAMLSTGLDYAPRVAEDAAATLDRYAADWTSSYTDNCQATHVRHEQSAEAMDLRMSCLSRARAGMSQVIELLSSGKPATIDRAYALVGGLTPLSPCDDPVVLRTEAPLPADPDEAEAVVSARRKLAEIEVTARAGLIDNAASELDKLTASTSGLDEVSLQLEIEVLRGRLLGAQGKTEEAADSLVATVPRALSAGLRRMASRATTQLIYTVGNAQRRHDAAEVWVAVAEGLVGAPDATLPERAAFYNHRGTLRASQLRPAEAEADYRIALDLYEQYRGPGHINDVSIYENIAGALYNQGKLEESEALMRRSMAIESDVWGTRHPNVIKSRLNLALLVQALDRLEEAEQLLRDGLRDSEAELGPAHNTTTSGMIALVMVLQLQERLPEATELMRTVVARHIEARGEDHLATSQTRIDLARLLLDQDDYEGAEVAVRRGLAGLASLGEDHVDVLSARVVLADVIRSGGRPADAVPIYEGVLARWSETKPNSPQWADVAFRLAKALRLTQSTGRAVELARAAMAVERGPGGDSKQVETIEAWLAEVSP